jgi:hypothetical protein
MDFAIVKPFELVSVRGPAPRPLKNPNKIGAFWHKSKSPANIALLEVLSSPSNDFLTTYAN